MDKLVAVVTDGNFRDAADRLQELVGDAVELRWAFSRADILTAVQDADVLVGGLFDEELATAGPRLRLIQSPGIGTDGIDRTALRPGMRVANTAHHEDAMAEYAVWAAIGLRRGLPDADTQLRQGRWASPAHNRDLPMPRGLAGARVGLYGFGNVGERSWRAFAGFDAIGAAVTGRGAVDAAEHDLVWAGGPDQLQRLCTESDILLVSVPLGDRTRGVIGAAELDALGPDGILINVARGPVVDEHALYTALAEHRIRSAAIDVWYNYPSDGTNRADPATEPFGELDNVLLTPHISGVVQATFDARIHDIAANLLAVRNGTELINLVD